MIATFCITIFSNLIQPEWLRIALHASFAPYLVFSHMQLVVVDGVVQNRHEKCMISLLLPNFAAFQHCIVVNVE